MAAGKADLSPFCLRARGFVSQGRVEDALGLLGDVIKVDPECAEAYADRGAAYAMLKKFDLALGDFGRAFALGYHQAMAYGTVAAIHFELKQYRSALEYFSKAIELDPAYGLGYYKRSHARHKLGDTGGAVADLRKCLELTLEDDFKREVKRRLAALSRR